jgi:hypothetical protein
LYVYAGNAAPHTAKKVTEFLAGNSMKRDPHPPYSPDLAPCEFYPFEYIKGRLAGASFDAIFRSIESATLERMFQEWMDRLTRCCMAMGGLVEGM